LLSSFSAAFRPRGIGGCRNEKNAFDLLAFVLVIQRNCHIGRVEVDTVRRSEKGGDSFAERN
jgi:hypothetical protein